jgi:hypothetical protein
MKKVFFPIVVGLFLGCIIDLGGNREAFEAYMAGEDMSVQVYGSIQLAFSKKLKEGIGSVRFHAEPALPSYHTGLSSGRDTVTIFFDSDLEYGTTYALSGTDSCVSESGDTLANTVSFTTIQGENEPNNIPKIADTVAYGVVYGGSITGTQFDEDWFIIITAGSCESLFITVSGLTADIRLSLFGQDGSDSLAGLAGIAMATDTLSAAVDALSPYWVRVASGSPMCAGGRYQLFFRKK